MSIGSYGEFYAGRRRVLKEERKEDEDGGVGGKRKKRGNIYAEFYESVEGKEGEEWRKEKEIYGATDGN